MLPGFVAHNLANVGLGNAEAFTDFALADTLGIKSANLGDIGFCDFCAWMLFAWATTVSASTLTIHVGSIVFSFAKKQMVWVDAMAHIALVANHKAIRDFAIVKHVRYAMRQVSALWRANACIAVFGMDSTIPQPAIICSKRGDVLPEQPGETKRGGAAFAASWGIITHVVSSLLAIGQSRGRYQRRSATFIGSYSFILPCFLGCGKRWTNRTAEALSRLNYTTLARVSGN